MLSLKSYPESRYTPIALARAQCKGLQPKVVVPRIIAWNAISGIERLSGTCTADQAVHAGSFSLQLPVDELKTL
jgi:hypothetical protein